jgi:transcriptional regulator with XRE-family HTH domain
MPRVYLSEKDRLSARLSSWVYGEMKVKKIPQRELADAMGVSQQALSRKLKSRSFSFADFLAIVKVLEPDEKELNRLVGRGDK